MRLTIRSIIQILVFLAALASNAQNMEDPNLVKSTRDTESTVRETDALIADCASCVPQSLFTSRNLSLVKKGSTTTPTPTEGHQHTGPLNSAQ